VTFINIKIGAYKKKTYMVCVQKIIYLLNIRYKKLKNFEDVNFNKNNS